MAFIEASTFGLFFLFIVTSPVFGKNVSPLQDVLQQQDSSIQKRSLNTGGSRLTFNFQHGMRDFILNGMASKKTFSAFFATLTSGHLGPNYAHGTIKFNDVSLNIGNGYSPSTGKFTAPVDGIYQISFSFLQRSGYQSHVWLKKDGVNYSELHANHRNYDQLSKTVLMELKKGQKAWVYLPRSSNYAIYGSGRYTTLSGYLISHY